MSKTELKNGIYIKSKDNKNGDYCIPCLFDSYVSEDLIKIKFGFNINEYFIKDKIIKTNINCCIIIPYFVYNYFLSKYESNLKLKYIDKFPYHK